MNLYLSPFITHPYLWWWLQDEDEWKEFEEEKKDYTNLKIQNLQINENPSGDDAEGEDGEPIMEENEAGEMVPRKKQPSGPWTNVQQQQPQQEEPVRGPFLSEQFPPWPILFVF